MTVPAQTIYALTAAQLAQATFVAGAAGTSDDIYVQAYDGTALFRLERERACRGRAGTNHAPTVSLPAGANVAPTAAQTLQRLRACSAAAMSMAIR